MNDEKTPMAEMLGAFMMQSALIERLNTLGIEYHNKTITPERFAHRVYEELYLFQHPSAPATSTRTQT